MLRRSLLFIFSHCYTSDMLEFKNSSSDEDQVHYITEYRQECFYSTVRITFEHATFMILSHDQKAEIP